MDGVTGILIKLGARVVVFGLVFFFAARRSPNVVLRKQWAMPLIALVFALLNTSVYWALTPLLNFATLGTLGIIMPFVVNVILLYATLGIFQARRWIEITTTHTFWIAALLTVAHGLLWVGFDYLPPRL